MRRYPWLIPALFLALCVVRTHGQIPVWRSNLTLWTHAATVAPLKPRVRHLEALAMLESGQIQAGVAGLQLALLVATQPHVPASDRAITQRDAWKNLAAVQQALAR